MDSPATTIPGISTLTASVIYAELGNFSKFESTEKILAFAGMEPSIYQSGEYSSNHGKMVKRGSKYLRHTLYLAFEMFLARIHILPLIYTKNAPKANLITWLSHTLYVD